MIKREITRKSKRKSDRKPVKTHKKLNYSMNKLLLRTKQEVGSGKTVVLAMSGGVDSSVAAYLLRYQGYKVIGAFMKNWSDTKNKLTGECAWKEEKRYAMKICLKLKIPLATFDFEDEYKKEVVNPMFKSYGAGLTPNPDVLCNEKVKFPLFWKKAKKLGADYMATGHHIRKNPVNRAAKQYKMLRAMQEGKDQSYFLHRLTQKDLEKTLFPIGHYTKEEVRFMAEQLGLPNYDKKSTTGICFIGKINLKTFLQQRLPAKKGVILGPGGEKLGTHDGIMYYTVGQRIGPRYGVEIDRKPGITSSKRWYVASKNPKQNIIVVAPEGHKMLFRKLIAAKNFHFIREDEKDMKRKLSKRRKSYLARIRQVGELLSAKLGYDEKNKVFMVELREGITGVSQGQAIVLYDDTEVVGGGEIVFPELL